MTFTSDPNRDGVRAMFESIDVRPAPPGFIDDVMAEIAEAAATEVTARGRARRARKLRTASDLLIQLAGADVDRLRSDAERARYLALGSALILTTALAFMSMTAALAYLGASRVLAVGVAALFAAGILTFDRVVTSSTASAERWPRCVIAHLPRLALAVVISLCVTEPLLLRLFENEITTQLAVEQRAAEEAAVRYARAESPLASQRRALEERRRRYDAELAAADQRVERAMRELETEMAGVAGSRTAGRGPAVKIWQQELDQAIDERARLLRRLDGEKYRVDAELRRVEGQITEEVAKSVAAIRAGDGFVARERALDALAAAHPGMAAQRWLLMLLFVVLGLLPVLFKTLMPPSRYERELGAEEEFAAHLAEAELAMERTCGALVAEAELAVRRAAVLAWHDTTLAVIEQGRLDVDLTPPFAGTATVGRRALPT